MPMLLMEDADVRAFVRVLATLFGAPAPGDAAALSELINSLTLKVQTMSDNLTTKLDANDAKVDQLVAAVGSLEQRVAANDQKLATAQAERDKAVTDLASTKTTLDGVRAELAAITQVDTASIESRLQGESTKLQGAIDRLNAIDVTPAPAADNPGTTTPPATGGDGDTGGSTTDAPPPAVVDPNAPTGTEVKL